MSSRSFEHMLQYGEVRLNPCANCAKCCFTVFCTRLCSRSRSEELALTYEIIDVFR
jgi:hypothetical protein